MKRFLIGLLPGVLTLCSQASLASGQNSTAAPTPADSQPTWAGRIAPLVYRNCTGCHHPGGAGPFSLLTYADARRWGTQILSVTQSRYMPPWLPEPGHGDFADNRRLTAAELADIQRWVHTGMPQGESALAPAPPQYGSQWALGQPDMILTSARPLQVKADGQDVFHNFILPADVGRTRYVRAMEILPGNARVVHHANILIDRTAELRHQHATDWQDGVPGMEISISSGDRFDPDGYFLFWKPDSPAIVEPPGMAWRIDPGTDLILNAHLKPTGREETVQPQVGLYFTDIPPQHAPMLLQLEHDSAIDIPPGERNFVVEDQLRLPIAVSALGIYPHAHYLGKQMEAWSVSPDGTRTSLILIHNWDIDRQAVYAYQRPVLLPAGSVLHMRYTYDNSAANLRNPANPPVRVRAGNRSRDEMGHLWLQVLPVHATEQEPHGRAVDARMILERAWMEHRLERDPTDHVAAYNLASLDAMMGRPADALTRYQRLAAQAPGDARLQTSLGVAAEQAGDWQLAIHSYELALQLDPAQADARFDLATLQLRHDQSEAAAANYRTVLMQHANDAAAHGGLATALAQLHQTEAARAEFEQSLALDATLETALQNYAGMELESGNYQHARTLLKRAIEAGGNDASTWHQLALADAQTGDPAQAEQALESAIKADPADPTSHALLSQLLSAQGNHTRAIAEQKEALRLHEQDADGWSNLGALEARAGHTAEARSAFERALGIDPAHPAARANLARLAAAPDQSRH